MSSLTSYTIELDSLCSCNIAFLLPCVKPMTEEERRDGGGYHDPHYVNKVQEHVPVKPQCRAKWDEAEALDARTRGRR